MNKQEQNFNDDAPVDSNCVRLDNRTAYAIKQVIQLMENYEYTRAHKMLRSIQIDGRIFNKDWNL